MKDDEILDIAVERFRQAQAADQEDRLAADEDLRFAINDDGCQWPDDIRESRENTYPARPCLVLNKIPEKIDQIEGEFKQLEPSYKLRAVDSRGDAKLAEIYGGLIRQIEAASNARAAYNTAYTSCLLCGRGAWRIDVVDNEDDPFVRDIVVNRIPNVFTVYYDPDCKKLDRSDASYCFVTEVMGIKDFKAAYPGLSEVQWPEGDEWSGWRTDEGVRVAEYWWKAPATVKYYRVSRYGPAGMGEVTIREHELQEGEEVLEEKAVKSHSVKWCKMVAGKVIDGPHDWKSRYIPIIYQVGKEVNVRGKQKTRGMVRFAKTPQQLYNFWSSSITEQIALAPKSPYLVTAHMVGRFRKMWDEAHSKNYPYLVYDLDPGAPQLSPRREPPPALSQAVSYELERMDRDIMAGMGVYQASLGDQGDEKSGKAIEARQKRGNVGAYAYTANFQAALEYSIRVIIDLIPWVYDTERMVRIIDGSGEERRVPINATPMSVQGMGQLKEDFISMPRAGVTEYVNDLKVGRYDIAVDIGPAYATQREEALKQLLELIGIVPELGAASLDLLVQNMDIPQVEKLLSRAKKMVPIEIRGLDEGEEPPPPQPPDAATQLLELEKMKLELKVVEEQRKDFDSQINAIKSLAEAEAKERGQQLAELTQYMLELKQMFSMGQPGAATTGQNPPREVQ